MTPRPRTISDELILEAASRVIGRLGPSRFTLADVAGEVGLSPATLVQRFGSKRGLMLALAESAAASVDACFDGIRAIHADPLDALIAAATHMTQFVNSPEEMANHLAFLQIDLSDPEFRRLMVDNNDRILKGYTALLDEAVAAGTIVRCDTERLARAVGALSGGSLLSWAIMGGDDVAAYVRGDLETLLTPYRRAGRARTAAATAPLMASARASASARRGGASRRR